VFLSVVVVFILDLSCYIVSLSLLINMFKTLTSSKLLRQQLPHSNEERSGRTYKLKRKCLPFFKKVSKIFEKDVKIFLSASQVFALSTCCFYCLKCRLMLVSVWHWIVSA
jgi:hypothetical protein